MSEVKLNNGHLQKLQNALDDLLAPTNRLLWEVAVLAGRMRMAIGRENAPVAATHIRILRDAGAQHFGGDRWELRSPPAPAWAVLEAQRQVDELMAAGEITLELEPIPEALIRASSKPVEIAGAHRLLLIEVGLLVEDLPPVPEGASAP